MNDKQDMPRPTLDYAISIGAVPSVDTRISSMTEIQRICAGIAWMADNEGYGIQDAARDLIARVAALPKE